MQIFPFLFFLFTTFNFVNAQTSFKSQVLDSLSGEGIPYAHIIFDGGGLVSDEKGNFEIKNAKSIREIRASSLGYEVKQVLLINIENNTPIFLSPIQYELASITVNPKKRETIVVDPYKRNWSWNWFCHDQVGLEMVHYFPAVSTSSTYLQSFSLFLDRKIKTSLKLRVRIYSSDENGKPNESIISQSIFYDLKGKKGWREIDVTDYHVLLPTAHGYFVGIEYLPSNKELTEKYFCFGMRAIGDNRVWEKFPGRKWFQTKHFKDKKGRYPNLMTKVKLERLTPE